MTSPGPGWAAIESQLQHGVDQVEAAAFRFGQRARALIPSLPTHLPLPSSVDVHFGSREKPGDSSWIQILCESPEDVRQWAEHWGAPVAETPFSSSSLYVDVRSVVDGLTVHATATKFLPSGGQE
ncbi:MULTISPECIES: hypothetical protein [Streptomyces]|uniref:Uncharacterized protein n=1 Tax=Streptomyces doudnae TaxID=3075536 RepID=A0ABD5ENK8_9ACTN|nr:MULTISPECIES: hypothetical protein [unclassified Streptomyces]MDT0435644.1 hypothetical protein [Streptomyces sp. DSM 41981]MYQ62598.1 hypothetical protein [Streptomyces sp. SID4950]SCD40558.1 hypothetical protein GA0115242_1048103 [Streptomyces sp. SolWspMP-5a-2]